MGNLGFQELLILLITVILPAVLLFFVLRALVRRSTPNRPVAEELERLFALKEKGAITEEEFQTRKMKLLSK